MPAAGVEVHEVRFHHPYEPTMACPRNRNLPCHRRFATVSRQRHVRRRLWP
jgi:hypothetical protein